MSKEKTKTSAEEMLKLHEHTQTLTPEMAERISQDDLWNGLLRFVHEPEKFNAQIENSTVKTGASDRPDTVFERGPLQKLAEEGELMSYRHKGYWQCMDTKNEMEKLEKLLAEGRAPWKVWKD